MSALREILAAKKQDVLKAAGASPEAIAAAGASVEVAPPKVKLHASKVAKELNEELAQGALAVYENLRLNKAIHQGGGSILPVNGYFYAMNEKDLKTLESYANGKMPSVARVDLSEDAGE